MSYIKSIFYGAALLSLALLFVPERPALRRATLTVFSLLLLLLLLPSGGWDSLSALLPDASEQAVTLGDAYLTTVTDAVDEGVRADLSARFSLVPEDVHLQSDLALSQESLSGTYLHITLGRKNLGADAPALIRYVKNTYGLDCEVYFAWT